MMFDCVQERPYTPEKSAETVSRDNTIRGAQEKLKRGEIDIAHFLDEVTKFPGEAATKFPNYYTGMYILDRFYE